MYYTVYISGSLCTFNFSFLFEISDAVGKVHGRMQKAYALYSKKLADGTLVGNNCSCTYANIHTVHTYTYTYILALDLVTSDLCVLT